MRPNLEQKYKKGDEEINFVLYQSSSELGYDKVLQHKIHSSETAHMPYILMAL